jgi:hypothetical protein
MVAKYLEVAVYCGRLLRIYVLGALNVLGTWVICGVYVPLTKADVSGLQKPMANASANLAQKLMSDANGSSRYPSLDVAVNKLFKACVKRKYHT